MTKPDKKQVSLELPLGVWAHLVTYKKLPDLYFMMLEKQLVAQGYKEQIDRSRQARLGELRESLNETVPGSIELIDNMVNNLMSKLKG